MCSCMGKRGWGGGGLKNDELSDYDLRGWDHREALYFSTTSTPHSTYFQVLPVAPSGSKTSGTRAPSQEEPGVAKQDLSGSRQGRAVNEGSLIPMGQAYLALSRARVSAREENITSVR